MEQVMHAINLVTHSHKSVITHQWLEMWQTSYLHSTTCEYWPFFSCSIFDE